MVKKFTFFSFLLAAIFLLAVFSLTGLIINLEDRGMRDELLTKARLVGQAVDFREASGFSASEADLDLPGYRRLKERMVVIRLAYPKCRFIYLLGRRPDGQVFVFFDSENPESKDYSPPGQAFNELHSELREIFSGGKGIVAGPRADRWGTWISAFVPVSDPQTGKVFAVLGMDVEARNWRWAVIFHSFLPLNFFLLVCLSAGGFFYVQRRNKRESLQFSGLRAALQNSEARYRGFFQNSPDAMIIIEPASWSFISGNPEMLRMFGMKNESELLALKLGGLSPLRQPDGSLSAEGARRILESALDKSPIFFEWKFKRFSGDEFSAAVSLFRIDLVGKTMLQMIIRDITQKKKMEEENAEHLRELETFYAVSMGREERIIELKEEVERLKKELGR